MRRAAIALVRPRKEVAEKHSPQSGCNFVSAQLTFVQRLRTLLSDRRAGRPRSARGIYANITIRAPRSLRRILKDDGATCR